MLRRSYHDFCEETPNLTILLEFFESIGMCIDKGVPILRDAQVSKIFLVACHQIQSSHG